MTTSPQETLHPQPPIQVSHLHLRDHSLGFQSIATKAHNGLWSQGLAGEPRGSCERRGEAGPSFSGQWERHTACVSDRCQFLWFALCACSAISLIAPSQPPLGPPRSRSVHSTRLPWTLPAPAMAPSPFRPDLLHSRLLPPITSPPACTIVPSPAGFISGCAMTNCHKLSGLK